MKRYLFVFAVCTSLALLSQACTPAQVQVTNQPQLITVVVEVTPTPQPQAEATTENIAVSEAPIPVTDAQETTAAQEATTPAEPAAAENANTDPQCTVLQNVNFRKGPGKVFDPPFDAIVKDTVVIPQGFAAQGFPGGSWVQVLNPQTNQTGWISAGDQFVRCTIDLTTLAPVEIPPTPAFLRIRNSKPDGSPNGLTGKIHFSSRDLIRMEVYGPDGNKDGDQIQDVRFLIRDESGSTTFYDHTENNAPYCIFGGDSTCSPWPQQDGVYVWGDGGEPVQNGATYQVDIFATQADTDGSVQGNWSFTITVDLP